MKEIIKIPEIILNWSDYYTLNEIKNMNISNYPGVYRVKYKDEIIHIGKASSLRRRVKYEFVNGDGSNHSAKNRILKDNLDFDKIKIQWAETEWQSTAEEYLHKKYKKKYGCLPKYTKIT